MRVLCLHDCGSSARHLHATLNCLEERLWTRHDIELVFVNAPLLCQSNPNPKNTSSDDDESMIKRILEMNIASPAKKKSCNDDNESTDCTMTNMKNNENETKAMMMETMNNENCRCWWEESKKVSISDGEQKQQFIGLDASILQLQQLWSSLPPSSTATDSPFVGILGIGQGAALASILSLLSSSQIFDGLEFAIFIKGFDLIQQQQKQQQKQQQQQQPSAWFEEEPPIHTLHVMSSSSSYSEQGLYESFGGDLYPEKNQRYYLGSKQNNSRCKRRLTKFSTKHTIHVQDLNVLGRFIVDRKKEWQFHRQKKQSIIVPEIGTITNDDDGLLSSTSESYDKQMQMEKDVSIQQHDMLEEKETKDKKITSLEETRQKIDALERYALETLLPTAIASNPPKALIASIFRPTLQGAWMGGHKDMDRSKEFNESGGAPYPSSLLPKP